jgi:septin family protein
MDDMRKNNILLYKFPELNIEQPVLNGGSDILTNGKHVVSSHHPQQNVNNNFALDLVKRLPFAIVGSTHIKDILVGGEQRATKQKVRVREYPWGTVEVDNLAHNDFIALRDMIVKNNLIDLIEVFYFIIFFKLVF